MLAAQMVQTFHFTEPCLTTRSRFEDGDWDVGRRIHPAGHEGEETVDIIDLDGNIRSILHPGNASDQGKTRLCTFVNWKIIIDLVV